MLVQCFLDSASPKCSRLHIIPTNELKDFFIQNKREGFDYFFTMWLNSVYPIIIIIIIIIILVLL